MYYLHGSWKFIFLVAFKTSMSLILVTCVILQSLDYSQTIHSYSGSPTLSNSQLRSPSTAQLHQRLQTLLQAFSYISSLSLEPPSHVSRSNFQRQPCATPPPHQLYPTIRTSSSSKPHEPHELISHTGGNSMESG
jgi:hypothetical protein